MSGSPMDPCDPINICQPTAWGGTAMQSPLAHADGHSLVAGFVLWGLLATIYIMPSFIAWARHHRNWAALFAFNVLLGWTFVGWVVALVWALWRERNEVRP